MKGVQEMGVATVTKHYLFNNQETNRNSENSIVDDKTAWELYYPPFQAAVEAGGVGFMCSCTTIPGFIPIPPYRLLRAVV